MIAGAVVLYNSGLRPLDSIDRYIDALDRLYVIDNSDQWDIGLYSELEKRSKIKLYESKGNNGIAAALNVAANAAIKDGYEWLLLMDQDSYFDFKELTKYKNRIYENRDRRIALFTPSIIQGLDKGGGYKSDTYPPEVITSGSVICLQIFRKIGGFREDYFIYVVDYEYCWRLRYNGYKIYKFGDIRMHHQVDDYKKDGTDAKHMFCIREMSDSAFYYAFRNTCYLLTEYRTKLPEDVVRRGMAFIRTWTGHALRSKHFFRKMKYGFRGIHDYHYNITGKMK